ncbi:hypothetical protein [Nostoc sp. 'Peltigera membranacea cyanobiont' N6]|uniref:hypothetical protein n=1 Tax=Nostoc sp. 'Peltigera membranacea cyanobiont' N6 TaxID=1261031 RepID=UPI0011B02D8B|nr:hypothetical protein [Nostoc sp. 'Peltigera membranacea cyanobiont' N6]
MSRKTAIALLDAPVMLPQGKPFAQLPRYSKQPVTWEARYYELVLSITAIYLGNNKPVGLQS